jgi:flotillin
MAHAHTQKEKPMMLAAYVAGGLLAVLLLGFALFKVMWRVAEPNEALIVSGSAYESELGEGMGFRIVTGRGTLVMPGVHVVRRLCLDLREAALSVACVTTQGIPVALQGIVIFKIGDDLVSIANAARRFLHQQNQVSAKVHNVFAGHLRSIVGGLTVEDLIRDRDKLTAATRAACGAEMEKLGLIIDSLQIQEIEDPTGYIRNLALPHAAAVARDARVAQAAADRVATQAEQEAEARKAEATRDSAIQQSGYKAEMDTAAARARQAWALAEAQARQEVVVQETAVAELEATRREQQLQLEVRKPADAKAYETVTLAQAAREAQISASEARARETELKAAADATQVKYAAHADAEATRARGEAQAAAVRVTGEAEAASAQARGLAEAAAISARAAALAEHPDAVVAQELAENWPAIVAAGAGALANIEHLVVLNGADGMSDMLTKALTMGGAGLGLARTLLGAVSAKPAGEGDVLAALANGARSKF